MSRPIRKRVLVQRQSCQCSGLDLGIQLLRKTDDHHILTSPIRWSAYLFRCGNKRFASVHDDRLGQVHPATLTHYRRPQQLQPLACAGVDLEKRDTPSSLDAL
jgi:hypothetical protein